MRLKGMLLAVAMLGYLFAGAGSAQAQETHVGGQLSYGFEDWSELGLGVRATHLFTPEIAGAADVGYYFNGIDGLTFWELNLNAHYRLEVEGDITPYLGGGINYARLSYDGSDFFGEFSASESEVGLNLLGGGFMDLENDMRLFGEIRFVVGDADQLVITAGVGFPVG